MERTGGKERKKSRPVSELITLFDHQQFVDHKIEQWQSEKTLNSKLVTKTADKEKTTIASTRFGNSEPSKRKLPENPENSVHQVIHPKQADEERLLDEKKGARGEARGKTMITLTLKPKSETEQDKHASLTTNEQNEAPKKKTIRPKTTKTKPKQPAVELAVPKALEMGCTDGVEAKEIADEEEVDDRKKYPIDSSLAELRREMHSLRKQDVELMSQLLALNSSIQDFKSSKSSNSNSLSDLSDATDETEATDAETVTQVDPQEDQASWGKRGSVGSDESDYDARDYDATMRPKGRRKKAWQQNRESMGSEVSGYYSYNGSPYGSDSSLNGYEASLTRSNTGSEFALPGNHTGSNFGLPVYPQMYAGNEQALPVGPEMYNEQQRAMSPRTMSPRTMSPKFGHHRQPTWPNRGGFLNNERAGSDPSLSARYNDEDSFPVHSAQSYYAEDVRVKRKMFLNQNRRHSAAVVTGFAGHQSPQNLSRSGSEHSLYGYDVSSDDNGRETPPPLPVNRMQKWQRSNSSSAINSGRGTPPAIQRTIRVDLRNNVPAIELVLPIQPVMRSSAMRMAERRPLNKLNTLNKRQSMIW